MVPSKTRIRPITKRTIPITHRIPIFAISPMMRSITPSVITHGLLKFSLWTRSAAMRYRHIKAGGGAGGAVARPPAVSLAQVRAELS